MIAKKIVRKHEPSITRHAQVALPDYSPLRDKNTMSRKALKAAFRSGADFLLHSADGKITQTICSCRDFAEGATVELIENGSSIDCFEFVAVRGHEYTPRDIPTPTSGSTDIPDFMVGHPVELD